eukprot:jgi/Hompol1/1769/HPOL_004981-RA
MPNAAAVAAHGSGTGGGMVWNWDLGFLGMFFTSLAIGIACFMLERFKEYRHQQDPLWIEQMEAMAYTHAIASDIDTPHPSSSLHDTAASTVFTDIEMTAPVATSSSLSSTSSWQELKHETAKHLSSVVEQTHHHDRSRSWKIQVIRTSAYIFELGASLVIMSIFMLLNGWVSIAIMIGTGVGFFLFRMGLKPKAVNSSLASSRVAPTPSASTSC